MKQKIKKLFIDAADSWDEDPYYFSFVFVLSTICIGGLAFSIGILIAAFIHETGFMFLICGTILAIVCIAIAIVQVGKRLRK